MSTFIRIIEGTYRAQSVADKVFPLVSDYKKTAAGGSFVTVYAGDVLPGTNNVRVNVEGRQSFVVVDEAEYTAQQEEVATQAAPAVALVKETDEEVDARIAERFEVLDLMTRATIAGDVRGLIVTGPPGVGKSFGVEAELEKTGLFDAVKGTRQRYNIVKGASTGIAMYAALYKYSDEGEITVFDDCDDVLQDEQCLNLLKGALDSGKKRRLAWNTAGSTFLEKEGIPESFLFNGTVIFITNKDFEVDGSKKIRCHLDALMSRCHYLDLTMGSMREKLIRIKQVARTGELFNSYKFDEKDEQEVLDFMMENAEDFREMSLRMALKISDLKTIHPEGWQTLARATCMKPTIRYV
jgi:hypothetical protein